MKKRNPLTFQELSEMTSEQLEILELMARLRSGSASEQDLLLAVKYSEQIAEFEGRVIFNSITMRIYWDFHTNASTYTK